MTLELAGARVMAPIVGVSIYSWTGVIGVMLAGTACGNFLGGVLADKGARAALKPAAVLAGFFLGFCAAPADSSWPGVAARLVGGVFGAVVMGLGVLFSRRRGGRLALAVIIGGVVGYYLAGPVFQKGDAFLRALLLAVGSDPEWAAMPWVVRAEKWHAIHSALGVAAGVLFGLMAFRYSRLDKGAERFRPAIPLATSLFFAALGTLCVILSVAVFRESPALDELGLVERVLAWTFLLFFLPMLMLGTVSPQVIRLAVPDVRRAGRSIGTIYAVSTLGAIVGTFATGYFLIELVGTHRLILFTAFALTGLALYAGELWRSHAMLYSLSVVGSGAICGLLFIGSSSRPDRESKYYSILVTEKEVDGRRLARLTLDRLTHSVVDLDDPFFLHYEHEQVQGEFARAAYEADANSRILVIGGGGYTFPRWVETAMPSLGVTVVEIDPAVTEVAREKLGLPDDTAIVTHNMDGRQFVAELAPRKNYRLVTLDAVNDLSVPYHLLTREFNEAVAATLTDDGVYLLTLIDHLETGELWKAAADTLRQTYPHVCLLDPVGGWKADEDLRRVYVLYASKTPYDEAALRRAVEAASVDRTGSRRAVRPAGVGVSRAYGDDEIWTHRLGDAQFEELLTTRYRFLETDGGGGVLIENGPRTPLVLTDQKAPVDTLMSGTFLKRR